MSSPRPTRNAPRYQSPFLPINNTRSESARSIAGGSSKKRTLMDEWLEPDLPQPRPSFAEAGIERHGVVLNMAPLGTPPSAKILKAAVRPESQDTTGRVGMVKKSGASSVSATPSESMHTPEPTTQHSTRQSSAPATGATGAAAAVSVEGTVENNPLPTPIVPETESAVAPSLPAPTPPPLGRPPSQTPRTQGAPYGQSVFALDSKAISNSPRPVPQPVIPPPMNGNGEYGIDLRITDRVVESAVQQALDERRWPTAYALRTLYDDHRLNPRMVRLIDAIYTQRADVDERREFAAVMTHKKKEGRKDRTGEYYFNGDGSDPLPPPRAPIFSGGSARTPSFSTPSGRSATGAGSISDAQARRSSYASLSGSPYKETDSSQHVNKRLKSNDFKAPPDVEPIEGEVNDAANAIAEVKPEEAPEEQPDGPVQENGTPNVTTRSRTRSMSSSSSLSSIDEAVIGSGNFSNTASPLHKTKEASHHVNHADRNGNGSGQIGENSQRHSHSLSPTSTHSHLKKHRTASPRFANANGNANNTKSSAEPNPSMRNHSQPITAPPKLGTPKTFTFSTVHPSSSTSTSNSTGAALPSSTNNSNNPAANANANTSSISTKSHRQRRPSSSTPSSSSMAPIALLPPSNNTSTTSSKGLPPSAIFKTKKDPSKVLGRAVYDEDAAGRMKRIAREFARDNSAPATESFMRHQVHIPDLESVSDGGDSVVGSRPTKRPKVRLLNNKKTRQSQAQSLNYDSDTLSSPTLLSFHADLAPGSISTSRAATPNTFGRPTRKAKAGTGLRVKTSPMKKKGGTAGIPRASGERNSPTGNGPFLNNQDDNDDYCSSCGGNGDLVCCDGCTRSFHFKCVDPPMNEGSLPDEWFCNVCLNSRLPRTEVDGSFGPLLSILERKNPSAFHLPRDIREYFENVKTGTEGEYEEATLPKSKERKNGNIEEQQPDHFRLKDGKGKTILCHKCHLSASIPDRAIVPCSFCGLSWHLDCLDVPLAKEPGRPWKCPAHIDDLLTTIPNVLAPAHRFRKIKGSSVIKPAVSRGVKNNGYIEIENDPTDDEAEQGFYEQREYGRVYKLPELGIKLDFISQVRRKTGGGYAVPPEPRNTRPAKPTQPQPRPPPAVSWDQRNLDDQQAALNLAGLMIPQSQVADGDGQLLINALLSEAPPTVISMIAKGDGKVEGGEKGKADKAALLKLKAVIEGRLAALGSEEDEPAQVNSAAKETEISTGTEPTHPTEGNEKDAEAQEDIEMSG